MNISSSPILHPRRGIKKAFSLIEVTVALSILTILTGMVTMISYNTLTMSTQLVASQREEMRNQAFLDWSRRLFGNLPGNAIWQITTEGKQQSQGTDPILSDIVLQEVPFMLYWADSPMQVQAVRLRTLKQNNGLLKVVLECYDVPIIDETGDANSITLLDEEPIATTTLLEDVRWCEWLVRNPQTDEWSNILGRTDPRPYQIELSLALGRDGDNMREVFWIAPKQNPKVMINEMMAGSMRDKSGSGGEHNGGAKPPEGGNTPPSGGDKPSSPPTAPAPPGGNASSEKFIIIEHEIKREGLVKTLC